MAPPMNRSKDAKRFNAVWESFNAHYASPSVWGPRWHESLREALSAPTRYAALLNRFAIGDGDIDAQIEAAGLAPAEFEALALPRFTEDDERTNSTDELRNVIRPIHGPGTATPFPAPDFHDAGHGRLLTHWNLDAASLLAVQALQVSRGQRILDLCAAPGGKCLAIAQCIWPDTHAIASAQGCLHANERDPQRAKRLVANLKAYLPYGLLRSKCVLGISLDGTAGVTNFPNGPGGYDRVLVDAPCSSERHLIHAWNERVIMGKFPDELAWWKPASSKTHAATQVALLITALRAVKVGGLVVYATCSLSPTENDGVVEKTLAVLSKERAKGVVAWSVVVRAWEDLMQTVHARSQSLSDWAERTQHGFIVLPDHPSGHGWGPMFVSMLSKHAP